MNNDIYGGFDKPAFVFGNRAPMQPAQPAKKSRSLGTSLLPAAGATIAGLAAAPFTGGLSLAATIALLGGAAAVGGAAGELGAQNANKEDIDLGRIGKEGALSGAFGAGGAGLTAFKAAKAAGNAASVTDDLGRLQKAGTGLRQNVVNPKTKASAFGAAEDRAITDTVNKYVGGLTSASKYERLGPAVSKINTDISRELAKVPKKVEVTDFTKRLTTSLSDDLRFVPGDATYERELTRVLSRLNGKAVDGSLTPKALFETKKYLGNQLSGAFGKNGTDLTVPQQVRMAVWERLDDFITDLAPSVKNLTVAQSRLIQSAKGLQQSANKTAGVPLLGLKSRSLEKAIQGGQEITGRTLQKVGGVTKATAPIRSKAYAQVLPRTVLGGYAGEMNQAVEGEVLTPEQQMTLENAMMDSTGSQMGGITGGSQSANATMYPLENVLLDVQRDPKHAEYYMGLYEFISKASQGPKQKPMSAEAAKVTSNAELGLQALGDLENLISQDPGALRKTAIPGRGIASGILGRALGTQPLDAARQQVVDIIARLRTGAAITKEEAAMFNKFLPQAYDTPQVQSQKLNYLQSQFQNILTRTGGSSTDSLEEALLAASR